MADAITADWVAQMAALTVAPACGGEEDDIASATAAAALLFTLARDAQPSTKCPPGAPEAERLVAELAALDRSGTGRRRSGTLQQRRDRFTAALGDATFAVYVCRRVLHPAGSCLFSVSGETTDLCGRVLAAAHRHAAG